MPQELPCIIRRTSRKLPRHCEEPHGDVAIRVPCGALHRPPPSGGRKENGLPRRFAPRNDSGGRGPGRIRQTWVGIGVHPAERAMPVLYIGATKSSRGDSGIARRCQRYRENAPRNACGKRKGRYACGKRKGRCQQSYGLPSPTLLFSLGLKSVPRTVFHPGCAGAGLKVNCCEAAREGGLGHSNPIIAVSPEKKNQSKRTGSFFLGWIMGFEPTTFRATI